MKYMYTNSEHIVKLPDRLTWVEIQDIGMSFRHDFGITLPESSREEYPIDAGMTPSERKILIFEIEELYRLIKRTLTENHKYEH